MRKIKIYNFAHLKMEKLTEEEQVKKFQTKFIKKQHLIIYKEKFKLVLFHLL